MVTIRKAREDDIPLMVTLLSILFEQEVEHSVNLKAQEEGLRQILEHPHMGQLFVLDAEEKCVAMVSLLFSISTALGGKVAWLEDMIVHPKYRHKTYGTQLLEYALHAAKKLTCKRITLLTDADNKAAHHFYEKVGFQASSMQVFKRIL